MVKIVLMAIAMFFIPDSPRHLVHKGKDEAARKSLRWLRGSEYRGVDDELSVLQKAVKESKEPGSSASLKDLFTKGVYLKPFSISLSLMFLQQLSGISQVLFYLQDIFIKAGSDLDPGLHGFIVTLMQVN